MKNFAQWYGFMLSVLMILVWLPSDTVYAQGSRDRFLGFNVRNSIVDIREIVGGGPPKDGIPAILNPRFLPPQRVNYLRNSDMVVSVTINGQTRAYPLSILVWHEIVNDTLGGEPIAVTYCPLCGTCMVFNRYIKGRLLSFGVSGLLYRSDVLLYDHQTESLWTQLGMRAVSGRYVKTRLPWIPADHMTWAAWRARYPEGQVLSPDTGFNKNYGVNLYENYMNSPNLMFNVPRFRMDLPNKAWVVGIVLDGVPKAYPYTSLQAGILLDKVGTEEIELHYDPASRSVQCYGADGLRIPHVSAYWFAWQAFYPGTDLFDGR